MNKTPHEGPELPGDAVKRTDYDGKEQKNARTMSDAECRKMATDKADVLLDFVHGVFRINRPGRKPLRYKGRLPSLGPRRGLPVLLTVMGQPGWYWTPYEIGKHNGDKDNLYIKDNIIPAVAATRRVLGESAEDPHYILTGRSPYSVAWNPEASYCIIERANGDQEEEV